MTGKSTLLKQIRGFYAAVEGSTTEKLLEGEDKLYRELIEQAKRRFPDDPVIRSLDLRIGAKSYRREAIAALKVILGTIDDEEGTSVR